MTPKTPVILVVLVETAALRWFVAALELDGRTVPLLRSEDGDLAKYRGLAFDEQVAFIRHRFCGVLQKGCDKLWVRDLKACQFAIVFEGLLPDPTGTLTQAAAEHFAVWMVNPPAVVSNRPDESAPPERLAGHIDAPLAELLNAHLGELLTSRNDPDAWELLRKKAEG